MKVITSEFPTHHGDTREVSGRYQGDTSWKTISRIRFQCQGKEGLVFENGNGNAAVQGAVDIVGVGRKRLAFSVAFVGKPFGVNMLLLKVLPYSERAPFRKLFVVTDAALVVGVSSDFNFDSGVLVQ